MHAYRFILRFEDYSDFSREVDILADQTFEDFYNVLAENLKFDKNQWAAFYISNHNFRKKKEILKTLPQNTNNPKNSEEAPLPVIMPDSVLNDFIDDPHQRLLFVFDESNQWTFYIEMMKIFAADENKSYPMIVKTEGETPRELLPVKMPVGDGDADDEEVDGDGLEDEDFDDSAFYNNEDITDMETEEVGTDDFEEPDFSVEEPPEDFDEEKP